MIRSVGDCECQPRNCNTDSRISCRYIFELILFVYLIVGTVSKTRNIGSNRQFVNGVRRTPSISVPFVRVRVYLYSDLIGDWVIGDWAKCHVPSAGSWEGHTSFVREWIQGTKIQALQPSLTLSPSSHKEYESNVFLWQYERVTCKSRI